MANYRIGRKRRGVTWSNNVTEGNGRLVFKRDLEFAMDRFKIWFWYKVTIPSPETSRNHQEHLMNWALNYEHFRLKLFELESLHQNRTDRHSHLLRSAAATASWSDRLPR